MKQTHYIWKDGYFIPWASATVHVLTHALHYGTGVFEGIRAYNTANGPAIFRLDLHTERLFNSAKIYKMDIPFSEEEINQSIIELIEKNELNSCYIRPLVFRGYGAMGLNPKGAPVEVLLAAWEWGTYLGDEGLDKGIRCKISTWKRIDSNILPAMAKCTANYANSVLAKTEVTEMGYDEAIMLNIQGDITEGPGENIFMVKNNKLYTPPSHDSILLGITAQSIIQIARDMGFEVIEKSIRREEIYLADELFFTGTAAEVTPIREVDNYQIGEKDNQFLITKKLQKKYFEVVNGQDPKYVKWLTFVK